MPLLLFLLLLCLPLYAFADVTPEDCLGCHEAYKGYVHGGLSCTDCHRGISEVPHADKLPKPACSGCHGETVKRFSTSIHMKRGMGCKNCHTTHSLNKGAKPCASCHADVSHRSLPSSAKHLGNLGCIVCHGRVEKTHAEVSLTLKGGRAIKKEEIDRDRNNLVEVAEWHALEALLDHNFKGDYRFDRTYAVAGDLHEIEPKSLVCSECHETRTRFGSAILKVRDSLSYEIAIDPKAIIPDIPALDRYRETVHGRRDVQCSDCHVSQAKISDAVCVRCHKDLYGVYESSIHAKKGATSCTDCHNPHNIKAYKELNAKERIAVCSRCHKDYIEKHVWLPNTTLHFDYLECTTCHSPRSEKSMVFFFAKREDHKKVPLAYEEFVGLAGKGENLGRRLERGTSRVTTSSEIADLFVRLQEKMGGNLVIDASILVTKVYHDYSVKSTREKACSLCHSENAPFYGSMYLILPEWHEHFYLPVKGTLLPSYPLGMLVDMVLLGQEKIKKADLETLFKMGPKQGSSYAKELGYKWIDLLGIVLFALVLVFVFVHLALRILLRR